MTQADRGLLHGTVEMLILQTLLEEPLHGFAVSRTLRTLSDGVVVLKDAALYQALHRMERDGLVDSEWGISAKGKRAKFYRITAEGLRRLDHDAAAWSRYVRAVARIMGSDPQPAEA